MILDEAVSALDKSVEAQVLNLLVDLKREFGLTYMFISHDLNTVRFMSDRVMVMYLGRVAEIGSRPTPSSTRSAPPLHRRAARLDAVNADPGLRRDAGSATGRAIRRTPSTRRPAAASTPRCRHVADMCRVTVPELTPAGPDHQAALARPSGGLP